jgi:hypothetical protein
MPVNSSRETLNDSLGFDTGIPGLAFGWEGFKIYPSLIRKMRSYPKGRYSPSPGPSLIHLLNRAATKQSNPSPGVNSISGLVNRDQFSWLNLRP